VLDGQAANNTIPEYLNKKFGAGKLVTFTELAKDNREEFSQGVGQKSTF